MFLTFTSGTVTFSIDCGNGAAPSAPITSAPHVSAVPVAGAKPKARIGSGVDSTAAVTGSVYPADMGLTGSTPAEVSKLLTGRVWTLSGTGKPFDKCVVTSVMQTLHPRGFIDLSLALAEVQ